MTKKKKNVDDFGWRSALRRKLLSMRLSPVPPTLETMDTDERFRKVLTRAEIPLDAPDKWKRLALHYALRYERSMQSSKQMRPRGRPQSRTLFQEIAFRRELVRHVEAEQSKVRGRLGVEAACERLKQRKPYKSMPQKASTLATLSPRPGPAPCPARPSVGRACSLSKNPTENPIRLFSQSA